MCLREALVVLDAMQSTTSIRVNESDKSRLSEYGNVGDSYADALERLLDRVEAQNHESNRNNAEKSR